MNKAFAIFIISVFFFSCKDRSVNHVAEIRKDSVIIVSADTERKMNFMGYKYSQHELNVMIDSALSYGNTEAYNKVSFCYFAGEIQDRFLYAALIMANKYNTPSAYFDVYAILSQEDIELKKADPNTRSMGMYYLLRSYKLGDQQAQYRIEMLYTDKGLPVPSINDFSTFITN